MESLWYEAVLYLKMDVVFSCMEGREAERRKVRKEDKENKKNEMYRG